MTTWDQLFADYHVWEKATFDGASADKAILKAKEEFGEFVEEPSAEEAVDIMMCLLAWASRSKVDLRSAWIVKFEKNKNRTWFTDSNGVHHHVGS